MAIVFGISIFLKLCIKYFNQNTKNLTKNTDCSFEICTFHFKRCRVFSIPVNRIDK